ncbi:MAG: HAD-IA family hydrolase [Paracoccaceae bacterium]
MQSYIFDLDGTLIHSAPDIQAAINTALLEIERPPLDLSTVISFIGNGVERLVQRSLHATGGTSEPLQRDTLRAFMDSYNADPFSRTTPYPGVVDCLTQLRNSGHKLAICTNKPVEPARHICAELDLAPFFDVIAGAAPGIAKKPNAEPLLQVMHALGSTRQNTLYVGDSTVDQATAHNADVPFVLFSGGYLNAPLADPPPILTFDDWTQDWTQTIAT